MVLAAIATIVCSLAAGGSATAQCMLANPSFEVLGSGGSVFAGWNQFGPCASSTGAAHGSRSARVTGPNTGGFDVSGFWQSQDSAPGQRWSASVCVSNTSASPLAGQSQALLNIEWRNAAGTLISYESHTAASASTPLDAWRVYSVESQPAPAGTASMRLLLGVLQGPADPTPQILFDAATCVSLGPPTLETLQWGDFGGGRTLSFSGRTWRVKGPGYFGPGPNLFDNSTAAASVDANSRLHLTIHKIGSAWYSSEVVLNDALGYGDYIVTTRGRLDLLDRNTVLGIFLWEYGSCYDSGYLWWNPYNEIDIEYSRWGAAGNSNSQFVAQPYDAPGNIHRFNTTFADNEVTSHAMRWLPQRVEYRTWRGGPDAESPANMIASWTYTGPHIPRPESPRVHLNMWQLAAPAVTQEVVFDAFTFHPACPSGNCGVLAVATPPVGSIRLAAAAPNPLTSRTTIRFSMAVPGNAELSVLDITGRRLRRLLNEPMSPGDHAVTWDGRNESGQRVPPGVYLYRLQSAGSADTKRVVVLQ